MSEARRAALSLLEQDLPGILAVVAVADGSAPREAGAAMLVTADASFGTIGGGALEYRVQEQAREMLASDAGSSAMALPLGPLLGQCCGGRVEVSLQRLDQAVRPALEAAIIAEEAGWPEIVIFGAGHVGRALALALHPLPCRTTIVDDRPEQLLALQGVRAGLVRAPLDAAAIDAVPEGGYALVMTHSHSLDLDLVEALLRRDDLAWTGLIGSATKRARFERQLRARGLERAALDRLVCPIGITGIAGKAPAVIAAATAAQLLMAFDARQAQSRLPALA